MYGNPGQLYMRVFLELTWVLDHVPFSAIGASPHQAQMSFRTMLPLGD